MEEEKFYNNIRKALENLPENISILEEQIEVELQMKYFEYAKKSKDNSFAEACFKNREELFDPEVSVDRKKEILSYIATIDEVKAFRTIEKFVKESKGEIHQWAILALQESRMLLQTSLLDEQQVFISTGLGGKGMKLRYYAVFIGRTQNELLNNTQQKLLRDELIYGLNLNDGEFESMAHMEGFSSALVMLPLHADIRKIFQGVIDECNQYGNFLDEDMIITNVKELSRSEIIQLLHQNNKNADDGLETP
jgi:hypothetical protein